MEEELYDIYNTHSLNNNNFESFNYIGFDEKTSYPSWTKLNDIKNFKINSEPLEETIAFKEIVIIDDLVKKHIAKFDQTHIELNDTVYFDLVYIREKDSFSFLRNSENLNIFNEEMQACIANSVSGTIRAFFVHEVIYIKKLVIKKIKLDLM